MIVEKINSSRSECSCERYTSSEPSVVVCDHRFIKRAMPKKCVLDEVGDGEVEARVRPKSSSGMPGFGGQRNGLEKRDLGKRSVPPYIRDVATRATRVRLRPRLLAVRNVGGGILHAYLTLTLSRRVIYTFTQQSRGSRCRACRTVRPSAVSELGRKYPEDGAAPPLFYRQIIKGFRMDGHNRSEVCSVG